MDREPANAGYDVTMTESLVTLGHGPVQFRSNSSSGDWT
jgi:hypothetical protein